MEEPTPAVNNSSSSSSSSPCYRARGDAANAFLLVGALGYAFLVLCFARPGSEGVVDEHWKKAGFCIHNKEVPYRSSFDACLYLDVVLSAVLGAMYLSWSKLPGMEAPSKLVPSLVASTVGHGVAHGVMAKELRERIAGGMAEAASAAADSNGGGESGPKPWQLAGFCVGFWFPLLGAALPGLRHGTLFLCAVAATCGNAVVRKELAFGYVQTVVNVAFAASQLLLPPDQKNEREYALLPLAGVLPIVVSWAEALCCDSLVRSLGGHALYDASIIVSVIVFYSESYLHCTAKRAAPKKTGDALGDKEKTR
ncbi:unnamed protein product [Pseudo-nitzschia multistriata]|uniref:Uncharacterized protein n=1 Tax=Pseudo-nitzschia multistriata TaxID=183589 RepID=A0A448Z1G7_9STRA|nr:unnamed protein product [Pseudo-nitzschia multistriata]